MPYFKSSTILCLLFVLGIAESSPAAPALQHLNSRDQYQGGWPLALSGTNSGSCPTDASVQCTSTDANPECCPSGQTCFSGATQVTNYCCPTSADCNTAVLNFPRCANTTWNMFLNDPSGYFCCEPGTLGVVPSVGKSGGICEPSDQVVPTSLLATMVSQVGVATQTPSTTATVGASNATTTASVPAETNPSLLPSSTPSSGSGSSDFSSSGIESWSKPVKIGVGIAVGAAVFAVVILGSICNRRRRNSDLRYGSGVYTGRVGEFDEYGNRVPGYTAGYEPYRRADRPVENNVTVNVVQGDLQS